MKKDQSPFEQRLRALIAEEKEKRGGHFLDKDFCESIGVSSQALGSMRKGMKMVTLGRTMKVYPHWDYFFLLTGEREAKASAAAEPDVKYQTSSHSVSEEINRMVANGELFHASHVRHIQEELMKCTEQAGAYKERIRLLELQLREVTPGVSKRVAGAG